MWTKSFTSFAVCITITVISVSLIYFFSKKTQDKAIYEKFTEEVKQKPAATDDEQNYKDRLFVIKMFDTIDMKPTAEQLDHLASLKDRIAVMQYIIDLDMKNKSTSQQTAKEKPEAEKMEKDVKDIEPKPKETKNDATKEDTRTQEQAPSTNDSSINEDEGYTSSVVADKDDRFMEEEDIAYRGYSVVKPSKTDHPARQYIRDMYMMLGRIDAML